MQIENKKVIFVVPSLKGGGAEKVAATLLDSLQKTDDDIKLVLVLFSKKTKEALGHNIDVKYLGVHARGNICYTITKFFKVIYRLTKIIKEESPYCILSFMDYSNVVSIICNWLSGKKNRVIISVHNIPIVQMRECSPNFWERIMGLLIKVFYNKADSIIAVSKHVGDDLVKNSRINKKLIHIIKNPIDIDRVNHLSNKDVAEEFFNEDAPIILGVGRLSKEKGFKYLLKAFSLLREKSNARLVILGEGKEEANLKELSINLGIDKKVFFLGFKDNPYKYMKRSTIFVLPSLYESFGLVMIEAMACGIPVIATNSYVGIEDIIEHEKNGLIIPVADENALAESILRLLDDMELRLSMSEEAKKNIRKFSIERITDQYKAVLGT
jgi:glycosyltransferase involved in cell wall biosynthesis